MTNEELEGMTSEGIWGLVDIEHRIENEPSEVALLHRSHRTYTETMWIRGYVAARCIIITHPPVMSTDGVELPGVVREIPIGRRDARTFRDRFERTVDSYIREGWERKATSVYSADPWDARSVLDDGPTF